MPVAYEDDNSAVFEFGDTLINLLQTAAALGLIEPAAVGSRDAGSRIQFTIEVDDVDAMCAGAGRTRRGAAERPDGSAMGDPNRQLPRSRRPHLGDRAVVPRPLAESAEPLLGGDYGQALERGLRSSGPPSRHEELRNAGGSRWYDSSHA